MKMEFPKDRAAVPAGVLFGFLLWALSQPVFGGAEPWEGDYDWLFFLALSLGGFFHVAIFRAGVKSAFSTIFAGQALFALYRAASRSLHLGSPLVAVACAVPILIGAVLAQFLLIREGKKKDDGTAHPL